MWKRVLVLFSLMMFSICFLFFALDNLSSGDKLHDAAAYQHRYKLKISDLRGTIYDCKNIPLVNDTNKLLAAVIPNIRTLNRISQLVSDEKMGDIYEQFSKGNPFVLEIPRKIEDKDIDVFNIPVRYSGVIPAAHMIGYLSGDKLGVCGIEKAYNDYLRGDNEPIYVKYSVDASNRILNGDRKVVQDNLYRKTKGVVLNIDKRIQMVAEEISNKYIKKGAVLITEVPNCEIRAAVSLPGFLPQSIGDYLKDGNSSLMNRNLCSYNIGSIFKLITASAALEKGVDENIMYKCTGGLKVEDWTFHCFNGKEHDDVDMEKAMARSCNTYFINLINHIGSDTVLEMSKKFRLGEEIELAPGMQSSAGILPSDESLKDAKTAANFSFGQGKLMVTPVQIAGVINTFASDGIYSSPKLVKYLVDENMTPLNIDSIKEGYRLLNEKSCRKIRDYMKASVDYGTSARGKPEKIEAGAKTSTAETGILSDGGKVIQAWYAGFFPFNNPKYCIVILSEEGTGGGQSCGPVFRELCDKIYHDFGEFFS